MICSPRFDEISRITPHRTDAAIQQIAIARHAFDDGHLLPAGEALLPIAAARAGEATGEQVGQPVQVAIGDRAAADAGNLLRLNSHG